MYNHYFNCPYYHQCWENAMMRGQTRFGPPMGGPPMGGPPMGGGGSAGAPTSPPPALTPQKTQGTKLSAGQTPGGSVAFVSGGSLAPCLYNFVYLWLTNGNSYWTFLIYVDNTTAAGFRWTGSRWAYFGMDLKNIDSFYCYL